MVAVDGIVDDEGDATAPPPMCKCELIRATAYTPNKTL